MYKKFSWPTRLKGTLKNTSPVLRATSVNAVGQQLILPEEARRMQRKAGRRATPFHLRQPLCQSSLSADRPSRLEWGEYGVWV
jgi:hypothetical protein